MFQIYYGGRRDRMEVGFTTTYANSSYQNYISKVVSSNPTHGELCTVQHYVVKFVSDFWQVIGFL